MSISKPQSKPLTETEKASASERLFMQESDEYSLMRIGEIASYLTGNDKTLVNNTNLGFARVDDSSVERIVVSTTTITPKLLDEIQNYWSESSCKLGSLCMKDTFDGLPLKYYPVMYDLEEWPGIIALCHRAPSVLMFDMGTTSFECACVGMGLSLTLIPKSFLLSSYTVSKI